MTRKAAPKQPRRKPKSSRAGSRGPGRPSRGAAAEQHYPPNARVIKRYGNRRLYDPAQSRCVTMTEIAELVRDGQDVRIVDGDTGEDLTKRTLVQIILEQQNAAQLELLPVALLHQMISLGETPVAGWLAQYLQAGAEFVERQSQAAGPSLRDMTDSMGTLFPWLNADAWKGAAQPFTPGAPFVPPAPAAAPPPPKSEAVRRELDELERRLAELNARLGRG